MTAVMTAASCRAVYDEPTTYSGPVCRSCGGPCWFWKGSVWEYTCTACIDRHLDESLARWEARERREQEKQRAKIARNMLHDNDDRASVTASGERREGGGTALCAASPPGASRAGEGGGSALCAAPLDGDDDLITRKDT